MKRYKKLKTMLVDINNEMIEEKHIKNTALVIHRRLKFVIYLLPIICVLVP